MRSFSRSLPMELMRAREAVMREFRPILAEHDLTEQQWRVLRALAAQDRPLDVGELAQATFLLGPSLSRMLMGMESRGLVSRSMVRNDGRRTAIALTRRGLTLVARIAPRSEERYAAIETQLGVDRMALLEELLHDVAALGTDTTNGLTQ